MWETIVTEQKKVRRMGNKRRIILVGAPPAMYNEDQIASIRAAAPDHRVVVTEERAEIEAVLQDIEIIYSRFPRDLLPGATSLGWFQQTGAGADWLLRYPEAIRQDFVLTNASGVHPINISEHVLAFMTAFARGLHDAIKNQQRHEWHEPELNQVFELAGKNLLVIGVGAIGSRIAQVASALGMRVLGLRRHPSKSVEAVSAMYGPGQLLEALPKADFVVLTVPLTHETSGMIGEMELSAMKSTAYLINVGRGGTVQETALVTALEEGTIAGAGLDVFEQEPLPEDSPLWEMDNVIITCHYSGLTPDYDERALGIFLDNLHRYRTRRPLLNRVNKEMGY